MPAEARDSHNEIGGWESGCALVPADMGVHLEPNPCGGASRGGPLAG